MVVYGKIVALNYILHLILVNDLQLSVFINTSHNVDKSYVDEFPSKITTGS